MSDLLPCPFCGGEAHTYKNNLWHVACENAHARCVTMSAFVTEAEAIAAWNSRAAMEFDNWFYLPKPKEPIVEVAETTHAWDGTKVKTDVFYQVQEQAVINWAKELDEHIIKRICEVWNSRAERTCQLTLDGTDGNFGCSECLENIPPLSNYCPNCGCKVVSE